MQSAPPRVQGRAGYTPQDSSKNIPHVLARTLIRILSFKRLSSSQKGVHSGQREFLIDDILVRNCLIIIMIGWTGLAPWKFEFTFLGTSTFHGGHVGFDPQETQCPPFSDNRGVYVGRRMAWWVARLMMACCVAGFAVLPVCCHGASDRVLRISLTPVGV